jgi:hypothetical protein
VGEKDGETEAGEGGRGGLGLLLAVPCRAYYRPFLGAMNPVHSVFLMKLDIGSGVLLQDKHFCRI